MNKGKAMKDILVNKLQNNPELNPFGSKYCAEDVKRLIVESDGFGIANATDYFNQFYTAYIDCIKESFELLDNNAISTIQYLIAIANREVYLVSIQLCEAGTSIDSISNVSSFQVESAMGTSINAINAQEGVIDNLNAAINILRYGKVCNTKFPINIKSSSCLKRIFGSSNLLYVLKKTYDIALWENGYANFIDSSKIEIKYRDNSIPIIKSISDIRLNNNILGTSEIIKKLVHFPEFLYDLDCVKIDNNGYLQYFLCKKRDDLMFGFKDIYPLVLAELTNYYPFITQENFVTCAGIGVKDFIIIFVLISEIINNIHFKMINEKNTDDTNIDNFMFKMKKRTLISYLKARTKYTKAQITSFLKMLESSLKQESRIDLWKKPLLLLDETYYFATSNILFPNYIYIVDEWLEMQDYDMKIRGKAFEQYVKHELAAILKKKEYTHKIPQTSKFRINNIEEEVDLIIILKNNVIVAELKCIKYPMDSRDTHNTLKILEKATKQSIRKTEFMKNNWSKFAGEVGELTGKTFVSLVITNFPIYSGITLNGVAITDYYLFDSYFRSGALSQLALMPDGSKLESKSYYYSSEEEMNRNLENFIKSPPSVEKLKKEISISQRQITLPSTSMQIYLDYIN